MPENKYNYARIKIALGDFLNNEQASNIAKGYSLGVSTVFKLKYSEFSVELLKVFRGFLWNIENNSSYSFFNPSDYRLELASIEKMKISLENIYNKFDTTIEEDEEILKNASGRLYFAVIFK